MGKTIKGVYVTKVKGANKLSYRIPEDMDGLRFQAFKLRYQQELKTIMNEN